MNRRFLAVVPEGLSERPDLQQLLSKLKRTTRERGVDMRWVPVDLWHVTLAFLGSVQGDLGIVDEWVESASSGEGMHLRFGGLGAFPSAESARVLWLGVQASQEFYNLQTSLSECLGRGGFVLEERPFRPHLTLGRFRNPLSATDLVQLGGRKHFGDYPVRELVLFESVLQGNIVKYSPQRRWRLRVEG